MKRVSPSTWLRLLAIVALTVSVALLLDYLRPVPAFCAAGSACDRVRASRWASIGPIPVPLVGVVGFASLLAVSLVRGARKATRALALAGGLVALGLVVLQAVAIGAFCKLCLLVDVPAMLIAVAALAWRDDDAPRVRVWAAGALLAAAMPLAWTVVEPSPPVPRRVAALWVPGKINVVEIADFECPFCRQLHPILRQELAPYGDRVHLTRVQMPLTQHSHARAAARAWCCADEQRAGEAMADALFGSESLSDEGCRRAAEAAGASGAAFDACLASARPDARIDADVAWTRAVWDETAVRGLPMVFIGETRLLGLQTADELRAVLASAVAGHDAPRWGAWAFASGVLLAWGAFAAYARRAAR